MCGPPSWERPNQSENPVHWRSQKVAYFSCTAIWPPKRESERESERDWVWVKGGVLTERARTVSIGLTAHVRSAVTAAAAFPLLNKLQPSNPSLISPPPGPVREKETWIYSWSGTSPKSYHTIVCPYELLIPSASLLSLSPHMWNPVTPVLGSQKSERGLRSPLKPSNTPLERHMMTTAAEFLFWWCARPKCSDCSCSFPLTNKLQPSNPSLISPPPGPVREKETWIYSWSGTSPKSYHTIVCPYNDSYGHTMVWYDFGEVPDQLFMGQILIPTHPSPKPNLSHSLSHSLSKFRQTALVVQSDPDLPGPDLPEPRFTGRVKFPQNRKFTVFHPDIPGTPIYRAGVPVNRGPVNRGPTSPGSCIIWVHDHLS
eukprot:sb/3465830/